MRALRSLSLVVVCSALAGSPARAQEQTCDLLPGAREAYRTVLAGREIIHISGPASFVCTGGIRIRADSVVSAAATELMPAGLQLIGQVFYSDSVKILEAARVDYERDRLQAQGDVVLTDRRNGSVIRSESLDHTEETVSEPARSLFSGRPRATIYQRRQEAAPGDEAVQPLFLNADWIEVLGETVIRARGDTELTRLETRGFADELDFFQEEDLLVLRGNARIEEEDFELVARRIDVLVPEGGGLSNIVAREAARLVSEDFQIESPELRLFFDDGKLDRLVGLDRIEAPEPDGLPPLLPPRPTAAAGLLERIGARVLLREPEAEPRQAEDSPARPTVVSDDYRLVADSIEALAPGQQLETITAVGSAHSEAVGDSLDPALPPVFARDWIQGDTLVFVMGAATRPDSLPADSVAQVAVPGSAQRVIETIIAIGEGGRARALYRSSGDEDSAPSLSYTVADRITARLLDGEVVEIEAAGKVRGIHGELIRPREILPDTAGRGSVGAAA